MTQQVTLNAGDNDSTLDAGIFGPASLGDFVWNDLNGDGIQDPGEPGVSGVTVNLKDADNNIIAMTTTDADGLYEFADLVPSTYSVSIELPVGFVVSPQNQGGDDAVDSDLNADTLMTDQVTLAPGENNTTLDMGINEPKICIVALGFETNADGLIFEKGQIIDDEFAELGIKVETFDSTNHPAMIFDTSMPTGEDEDLGTPNEGFGGPGQGAGGAQGEPGENSIALGKVLIISEDGDQNDPDDNDAGGCISFSFDEPVQVDALQILDIEEAGGMITAFDAGANEIGSAEILALGDNSAQTVNLGAKNVSRLDVCFVGSGALAAIKFCVDEEPLLGSIGDRIWNDIDGQGDQDAGEPGIPGVTVKLLDDNGTLLDTRVTGDNGEYLFTGLGAGTYQVMVDDTTLPDGFEQTGDPDDVLDNMSTVSLAEGEENLFQDFGYRDANVCVPFSNFVKDHFNTVSYKNNDGSVKWATPWKEFDPKGGRQDPTSGQVKIWDKALCLKDYPNTGKQPSVKTRGKSFWSNLSKAEFQMPDLLRSRFNR